MAIPRPLTRTLVVLDSKVRENCCDSSVSIVVRRNVELHHDIADVFDDSSFADEQHSGYGSVGVSLRDDDEDVAFAWGQLLQRVTSAIDHSVDDSGIDCGAAGLDPPEGIGKLSNVADPVLE